MLRKGIQKEGGYESWCSGVKDEMEARSFNSTREQDNIVNFGSHNHTRGMKDRRQRFIRFASWIQLDPQQHRSDKANSVRKEELW